MYLIFMPGEMVQLDKGIISILAVLRCVKEKYGTNPYRTQIAKLLYLAKLQSADVGYDFKDDNHGPYDRKIEFDLNYASTIGLIEKTEIDKETVNKSTKYSYEIKEIGEEELQKVEKTKEFKQVIEKIRIVCDKYGKLSTTALLDVVYKDFYKDPKELQNDILDMQKNLKKLFIILDDRYKKSLSQKIDTLLLKIEYSQYLLKNIDKIKSKTNKNIIVHHIKGLFNDISIYLDKIEELESIGDVEGIFVDLNDIAKKNELFTYDDPSADIIEFLDEDEIRCLKERTIEV
ncbi:MAG: hypothetical protein Q8L34_05655 [Candidatus Woesearchaeota archaeon]|nr:hypothetical protein [Candidatus Woesearchaeota archaeon]